MISTTTEIAPDVYRISTFHPDYGMQFNQFLVADDEPLLVHTGFRAMFPATLAGVSRVIDPSTLRWVGFSHFESDECGALNSWLAVAPRATPVCSTVGAMVSVNDFAERAARPLVDGECLDTGRRRVRFLATPQVPHGWDAGMFFEETGGVLFCSDLFFHPGDPEPLVESGIVERARDAVHAGMSSPLANDLPYTSYTDATLQRLADLQPRVLAVMHGSSFRGDGAAALRGLAAVLAEALGAKRATA